jgi:hypothetical protein
MLLRLPAVMPKSELLLSNQLALKANVARGKWSSLRLKNNKAAVSRKTLPGSTLLSAIVPSSTPCISTKNELQQLHVPLSRLPFERMPSAVSTSWLSLLQQKNKIGWPSKTAVAC